MEKNVLDEMSEILINDFWHLVAHKSELKENQDFIKLKLSSKEIVVFNDNGVLVAFDNLCPHRGTRILSGTNGKSPITCPYHSWTYKNGELKIPNKKKFIDCDINTADINKLDIDFCGEFIFVCFKPKISLKEQLAGMESSLEVISSDISERLNFTSYKFDSVFPVAIENALESEHVPTVHKDSLSGLKLQDGEYSFLGKNSAWHTTVGNDRINKNLQAISENFDISSQYQGYRNYLIFPFAMLSSTYGYSYSLQNFHPTKDGKTYFSSRFFSTKIKKNSNVMDFFFRESIEINRQIFEEDAKICSRVPSESWSIDDLKYSREIDCRIKEYRKAYRLILKESKQNG